MYLLEKLMHGHLKFKYKTVCYFMSVYLKQYSFYRYRLNRPTHIAVVIDFQILLYQINHTLHNTCVWSVS